MTSSTLGASKLGRRDLQKISRNVLFDRSSIEDLKHFSNSITSTEHHENGPPLLQMVHDDDLEMPLNPNHH